MNFRQILAAVAITAIAPLSAQAALYPEVEAPRGDANALDQTAEAITLSSLEPTTVTGYLGSSEYTTPSGSLVLFASPDSYSFVVAAGTTVTAVLAAYTDGNTPYPISNIYTANPTLRFYNTSSGLSGNVASASDTSSTSTLPLTLSYTFANAGTYRIAVGAGSTTGSSGDRLSGATGWNYTLEMSSATAVPEPESLAMMLAGLGAVGMLARRRKLKG